jgi:hypothetical protein
MEKHQVWLFGGCERGNAENCFIIEVEHRDRDTLRPLICQFIRRNTTIVTDCWLAYQGLETWGMGYTHLTVNHSQNFVNPLNPDAHTQTIESQWQKFKQRHKTQFGTHETLFSTYIGDFMWRKRFGGNDMMYNLWSQISENPAYICEA